MARRRAWSVSGPPMAALLEGQLRLLRGSGPSSPRFGPSACVSQRRDRPHRPHHLQIWPHGSGLVQNLATFPQGQSCSPGLCFKCCELTLRARRRSSQHSALTQLLLGSYSWRASSCLSKLCATSVGGTVHCTAGPWPIPPVAGKPPQWRKA